MELSNLEKSKNFRKAKRVGRGESSGKGKTSGKGYKGQKVRGKVRLGFEGGQLPIIKRLPFKRGIGNSLSKENITITLDQLNVFEDGSKVDKEALMKVGLLSKTVSPHTIKVVATGNLSKALKVDLKVTPKAKELIEKSKGEVLKVEAVVEKEKNA